MIGRWGMMVKKREDYLRQVAAKVLKGKKGAMPSVSQETGVPAGGNTLPVDGISNQPKGILKGMKWTRIAEKIARNKHGGPDKLNPGPPGYIPYKLLLKK